MPNSSNPAALVNATPNHALKYATSKSSSVKSLSSIGIVKSTPASAAFAVLAKNNNVSMFIGIPT